MNKLFTTARFRMTFGVLTTYLFIMVLISCVDHEDPDNWGECGGPRKANATDLSLFYEPRENDQYATESDTVNIGDFNIYLKIASEVISQSSPTGSFPGIAFALSCAPNLDFQNITSISMILLEPYGGEETGTNISSLVTTHDGVKLSDLRDFSGSMGQYKLTVDLQPENKSQLKTRTVLKLQNGSEKIFESTSPVLLTI